MRTSTYHVHRCAHAAGSALAIFLHYVFQGIGRWQLLLVNMACAVVDGVDGGVEPRARHQRRVDLALRLASVGSPGCCRPGVCCRGACRNGCVGAVDGTTLLAEL